jgi:hypothetical protein
MTEQQAKTRRGCFFYGCIAGLVMLFIVVVAGLLGLRYFKKMVTDFTDSKPAPLPVLQMTQAEMDQVRARVDEFRDAVKAGKATPPLTLSADEINALIATDPDLQPLKGKLYVTFEGTQIKSQLTVPMAELGLPAFRDRYLNGTGTFNLGFKNGMLRLSAQAITVKGKPLPDIYMQKIRTENLARNINSNPRASVALDKLEDIRVKDGKLVVVPKQSQ